MNDNDIINILFTHAYRITDTLFEYQMFYKENGNTVTDGLACLPSDSSNINRVNYIFTIPNAYGKIEFYAQPVTKSGRILNPVIIGSILKDDRGIQ